MSEIINLENLSNAELRAKCLALGLPNIPVTDTSRNVIIKRLRTTMSGGVSSPAAAKKTTRRETIATTPAKIGISVAEKVGDGSAAPNRADRRTISTAGTAAADEAASKLPDRRRSVNTEAVKDQRRSVRASPIPKTNLSSIKEQSRRTPPMVILDSDEEDEAVTAIKNVEQQKVTTHRSSSRQPSLGKTTTAIKTEYQGLSSVAEESSSFVEKLRRQQELVRAKEEAAYLKQQEEQLKLRRQQELVRSREEASYIKQQEEQQNLRRRQEERQIQQQNLQKQKEEARLRYTPTYKLPLQGTTVEGGFMPRVPVQKSPLLDPSAKTTSSSISNVAPRFSPISSPICKPTSNLYPQLETIDTFNRPSYVSGLSGSPTSAYNEFSDDTDTDVPKHAEIDSEEEKFDTPFLSDFARNLNRLKAEPLSGNDLSRRYTRSRTAHEVKGRVAMPRYGLEHGHPNWWENLVNLNSQYNLLRHLFLVSVLILVIFLFMQFWQ